MVPDYDIDNILLEEVKEINDLVVCFDSLLVFDKFDKHVKKLKKAYMMLGIIKRNFVCISRNCFVTLYKSLVRSHLEYANSVWYPKKQMINWNEFKRGLLS